MDTQTHGTEGNPTLSVGPSADTAARVPVSTPPADQQPPLDPLRRGFFPIERKTKNGTVVFQTLDKVMYARVDEGLPMYRVDKKVRGKAARADDKRQRRAQREPRMREK